jgi:hypothetical protein
VKAADLLKRFTFQAVIAGGFAVDTFYMLRYYTPSCKSIFDTISIVVCFKRN